MRRIKVDLDSVEAQQLARLGDFVEKKAFHDSFANEIDREDGLVNTRVRSMLQAEGFLFAVVVGLTFRASDESTFASVVAFTLLAVVPFLGIAVAWYALAAIKSAIRQLDDLKDRWGWSGLHDFFPPPFGTGPYSSSTRYALVLPWVIITMWLALMASGLFYLIWSFWSNVG